ISVPSSAKTSAITKVAAATSVQDATTAGPAVFWPSVIPWTHPVPTIDPTQTPSSCLYDRAGDRRPGSRPRLLRIHSSAMLRVPPPAGAPSRCQGEPANRLRAHQDSQAQERWQKPLWCIVSAPYRLVGEAAMPETEVRFDDVFESALQEALGGPEVVAAATARPPGADPQDAARRWRSAVQRRTAAEQAAYLRSRAEAADLEARRRRYQTANAVLVTLVVLVLFLFILLVYQLYAHTYWVVALGLAAVVLVGVALLWPRGDEDRQRLQAWRKTLRVPSWSAQDEQRFSAARNVVEATTTAWRRAIAEAILARLLAHMAVASFSVELRTLPAGALPAGLRESPDTSFHVHTETGLRLARLIGDLNGGSYALVGARGTGKTELLGALALGAYADEGAAPQLTVVLSAPVSYVPRDFVLQLFAVACSQVIDLAQVCIADSGLESTLAAELQALRTRAEERRQHVLNQATSSLEASA